MFRGFIDLYKAHNPAMLDRLIRAYYPWPGVWTKLHMENGTQQIIKFLPGKMIQKEGKKPVDIETFYRGYPMFKQLLQPLFHSEP